MREPDSQLAIELVGALKYVQLLGCGVVHEERDGDRSFIAIDHNYEATIEMHYHAYAGKVTREELHKQYPKCPCPFPGCEKGYADHKGLSKHVKSVHEGERCYCPEPGCEKWYSMPSDLTRHVKSKHPKIITAIHKRRSSHVRVPVPVLSPSGQLHVGYAALKGS